MPSKLQSNQRALRYLQAYVDQLTDDEVVMIPELLGRLGKVHPGRPLPGFCILDPVAFGTELPSEPPEFSALVTAYETFVSQPLGARRSPAAEAERVLQESGYNAPGVLGGSERGLSWFTPALRLVLLASRCEGVTFIADEEEMTFTAYDSKVTLQVSPHGAYSNTRGCWEPAAVAPDDVHQSLMRLPPSKNVRGILAQLAGLSSSPKAHVLLRLLRWAINSESTSAGWLQAHVEASLLKRRGCGEARGPASLVVTTYGLNNPLHEPTGLRTLGKLAGPKTRIEAAERAMCELYSTAGSGLLLRLFDALVPMLYTNREFRRVFGDPANLGRAPKAATIDRWATLITERVKA